MTTVIFRFCIVSAHKGLSSTWIVQNTPTGIVVGTKTMQGHLRAVLSPSARTAISITQPPTLHRSTQVNQTFVLSAERKTLRDDVFDLAMTVMFPGTHLNPTRRAPLGRNGRGITKISAAGRGEVVQISIGFSRHPPVALKDVLGGLGEILSVIKVAGDQLLYVCQEVRPFPYERPNGTLDAEQLSLVATGLPGLYRADQNIPGLLQILQTATSQIYSL